MFALVTVASVDVCLFLWPRLDRCLQYTCVLCRAYHEMCALVRKLKLDGCAAIVTASVLSSLAPCVPLHLCFTYNLRLLHSMFFLLSCCWPALNRSCSVTFLFALC
jgi:hypothetical protein